VPRTSDPSRLRDKREVPSVDRRVAYLSSDPPLFDAADREVRQVWNEADLAQWFVAVGQVPVGPISARQIDEYRELGQVNDESPVWRNGMADWVLLHQCNNLTILLAAIERERTVPPLPAVDHSIPEAPPPKTERDKAFDPDSFFISDSDKVNIGTTPVVEPSPRTTPSLSRLYQLLSIGFFIAAIITLGLVLLGREEGVGEAKTVEKIVEKIVYRDRIIEKASPDQPGNLKDGEDGDERNMALSQSHVRAKQRRKRPPPPSKTTEEDKTKTLMARLAVSTPKGGGPVPVSGGSKKNSSDAIGRGNGLTPAQMKRVVNGNKSALKSCYERSLKIGEASPEQDLKVMFRMTVGASGTVRKLVVGGGAGGLPSLEKCLTRSVRAWVFPATSGESELEFPFVFTPR
jgi:hypothetical protein